MEHQRQVIGKQLHLLDTIGSTNTELLDNTERFENGAVLCARRQTAGRGRYGRNWRSRDGGLYMSLLLKDLKDTKSVFPFILLSALAVVHTIQSCVPYGIAIKWPNDVYINHRKVCGILPESSVRGAASHVVIGIGLNVNNPVSHMNNLRHPAVSLKECYGEERDISVLLNILVDNLDRLYVDFMNGRFEDHLPELNRLLYAKGQEVEITSAGKTGRIIPLAFTEDARLRCLDNGKEVDLYLGEL